MEQINNDQTIFESSRVLGHQVENTPQLDTSKIILTAEVNPKISRSANVVRAVSATTTGNSTIYTTPTIGDFYLNSVIIGITKDATCDIADGVCVITLTPRGAQAANIIGIPVLTLTAQSQTITLSLQAPILLDRGSAITLAQNAAFSAGKLVKTAAITGTLVDYNKTL